MCVLFRFIFLCPEYCKKHNLLSLNQLLELDFDVDACGQVELHQGINRLVRRIDDVHQAHMGTDFELVARGLVDVRRAQDVEALDAGGQGHRALDHSAGTLGGVNDFLGRLIDQTIIESLQADTDLLIGNGHDISFKERTGNFVAPAILKRTSLVQRGSMVSHHAASFSIRLKN